MPIRSDRDVTAIMLDGRLVDEAIAAAHAEVIRRHHYLGIPIAIWRDGQVMLVPATEFMKEDDEARRPPP